MSEQKALYRYDKALYRYDFDFGRMGELSGLFLALSSQVEAAIGKTFDFDEALGKHSDVTGVIEPSDIKLVTSEPTDIAVFERLFGNNTICGRNVLEYLRHECKSCSESFDSQDEADSCCSES